MRRTTLGAFAASALLIAGTVSPNAAVIYNFHPDPGSLVGLTSVAGQAIFSDSAFAAHAAAGLVDPGGNVQEAGDDIKNFDGLLSLKLTFVVGGRSVQFVVEPDISPVGTLNALEFDLDLDDRFLRGAYEAGDAGFDQSTGLSNGNLWTMSFGTDLSTNVCFGPDDPIPASNCRVQGVWERVPEPALGLLFLLGAISAIGSHRILRQRRAIA